MRGVLKSIAAVIFPGVLFLSCAFGSDDALNSLMQKEENPLIMAVGSDSSGNAAIFTSPNGRVWTSNLIPNNVGGNLECAAYGMGMMVAAGNIPYYFISRDGFLWGRGSTGPNQFFFGVTFGEKRFVAVGIGATGASIYASEDGLIWMGNLIPNSPASILGDVAYGDGTFVAVGASYNIFTSEDGLVWTGNVGPGPSAGVTYNLNGVRHGNGRFVAVGDSRSVAVSEDGLIWSLVMSGQEGNLLGIAFGANRFVAVGMSSTGSAIYTSSDGTAWSGNLFNNASASGFQDVVYCNGNFVAVSNDGAVAVSSDGLVWQQTMSSGTNNLYGVACRP